MTKISGWVAAIGGLLVLIGQYISSINSWMVPEGAIIAIIFGIYAAYANDN